MSLQQKNALIALLIAGLTIASGFAVWWSFVVIAFASALWLTRKRNPSALWIAGASPAVGWFLTELTRDIFEDGRISAKLATLLHVHFAVAVYPVLALIIFVPSLLAAHSGTKLSETFR